MRIKQFGFFIVLGLSGALWGCAALSSVTGRSVEVTPQANVGGSSQSSSGDVTTVGVSEDTKRQVTIIENCRNPCPLDAPEEPDNCHYCYDRAQAAASKLTGVEHNHPRIQQALEFYSQLDSKMAVWRQNAAAAKTAAANSRAIQEEYRDTLREISGILRVLEQGRDGSDRTSHVIDRSLGQMPALEQFAKRCDEAFLPAGQVRRAKKQPAETCDLAKNRAQYLSQYVEIAAKNYMAEMTQRWQNTVDRLNRDNAIAHVNLNRFQNFSELASEQQTAMNKLYSTTDSQPPEELFAQFQALEGAFQSALTQASKQRTWPAEARFQDGSVGRAVRDRARADGLRVVRFGITDRVWNIQHGGQHGISHRSKRGVVLTRKQGESFCRLYGFTARAQYAGGGRYQAPTIRGLSSDMTITSCR